MSVTTSLRASVCLEFLPTGAHEEAGLMLRMNERHHYEVFVTLRGGQPAVVVRWRMGSLQADVASVTLGETRYLSTDVAGGFNAVYLAMYASGNGVACRHPADFDWFDYEEREEVA